VPGATTVAMRKFLVEQFVSVSMLLAMAASVVPVRRAVAVDPAAACVMSDAEVKRAPERSRALRPDIGIAYARRRIDHGHPRDGGVWPYRLPLSDTPFPSTCRGLTGIGLPHPLERGRWASFRVDDHSFGMERGTSADTAVRRPALRQVLRLSLWNDEILSC
jgi:hypothetical protein